MATAVEVVGVYPVKEALEPCHLVEITVTDSPGFELSEFRQEDPGQPQENWQVAYEECVLNEFGDAVVADSWTLRSRPELLMEACGLRSFFTTSIRLVRCSHLSERWR